MAVQGSQAPRPDAGPPPWERLDPGTRAAIRDLHRLRPAANAVALLYFALWAGGAWLVLSGLGWPARLLGTLSIGVGIHALATLMHEGGHGSLWRRRGLDRWSAFLCGLGCGLSATAYRVAHLEHHRHLRTNLDPEEFTAVSPHRWVQSAAFWAWGAVGGATYFFFVPCVGLARGTWRERRAILVEYAAMAAVVATVWVGASYAGRTGDVVACWALPMIVVVAITNVRGWAEHAMTPRGGAWTETRTVESNRVVSLLLGGTNYHLEHHLYPGVPWYRLHRLHGLLAPYEAAAGSPCYRSYTRFLLDAVRTGVHGVARGVR